MAREALPELEEFLKESVVGSTRTLQTHRGEIIIDGLDRHPIDYDSFRSFGVPPKAPPADEQVVMLGVQGYDFVVRSPGDDGRELFRARTVWQKWDADAQSRPATRYDAPHSLVTFHNAETGEAVTVRSHGVYTHRPWPNGTYWDDEDGFLSYYPEAFFVGERKVMLPKIWGPLTALGRLFTAADTTGNPVVWG